MKLEAILAVEIEPEKTETSTQNPENSQILSDLQKTYGEDGTKNALGWVATINSNPELQNAIQEELKRQKIEKDGQA